MLQELFSEFVQKYPGEKNAVKNSEDKSYKNLRSTKIITNELPRALQQATGLSTDYLFKGSVGKGVMAEVPHLSILDKTITESPEKGYYIVYLFDPRMTKFYLTLLQGWTQFEERHGSQIGKKIILKNRYSLQQKLRSASAFSTEEIGLLAERTRTKGYIWGTIFSKVYYVEDIPADIILKDDLLAMVDIYDSMKQLIGPTILDITIPTEADFQQAIQDATPVKLAPGPIPARPLRNRVQTGPDRDKGVAADALVKAEHKCEVDANHQTFKTGKHKRPYVEAHHFIPLSLQDQHLYSLDVTENIISLCPNCHRAFHYGEPSLKKSLIKKFYQQRKQGLQQRGIDIPLKELMRLYIKHEDSLDD